MLPTTYSGAATIEGEHFDAELSLGASEAVLIVPPDREVARWRLSDLEIKAVGRGEYLLSHDGEELLFMPSVDDGLVNEIGLRQRFQRPMFPADEAVAAAQGDGSIADRVSAAGRHSRPARMAFLFAPDSRRIVLGAAALIIVAISFGLLLLLIDTGEADEPTPTMPVESDLRTEGGTVPPAVAGVTVTTLPDTTQPPATTTPTTVAPPGSIFEVAPDALVSRWDALARPHSSSLMAAGFSSDDGAFGFDSGAFARVEGTISDGRVDRIVVLGDPSGTVADDREVLTALGLTIALVEPDLPPEGRRELLAALGLDVDEPDLANLDGTVDYRDNRYAMRWDGEIERIVFEVTPIR